MLKKCFKGCLIFICLAFMRGGYSEQVNFLSIAEIDKEIKELNQILHQSYMEEMRDEVDSQGFIIADWDKYSEEIQKIKQKEDEAKQIRKRINELEKRKAELLEVQNRQLS
jgi:hypothetical protein